MINFGVEMKSEERQQGVHSFANVDQQSSQEQLKEAAVNHSVPGNASLMPTLQSREHKEGGIQLCPAPPELQPTSLAGQNSSLRSNLSYSMLPSARSSFMPRTENSYSRYVKPI